MSEAKQCPNCGATETVTGILVGAGVMKNSSGGLRRGSEIIIKACAKCGLITEQRLDHPERLI